MGWTDARYQARQVIVNNTATNLTSGTGAILTWPCPYGKIKIEKFGMVPTAAFAVSATMTTRPVVQLEKTTVAGSNAILNALATITPNYSQANRTVQEVDLDTNTAAAGANTPIAGPDTYPTAVQGDDIIINQTVQGVGGTQTAKFYFVFREVEV